MSYLQNIIQRSTTIFAERNLILSAASSITFQQLRWRHPFSQRKYVQPHYRQKLLLACCEPVMPIDRRPDSEKCFNLRPPPPKPDHPYDVLLARDFQQELESSQVCCLLHQNLMNIKDRRLARNAFEHQGLMLRFYNRDIARIALADTKYAPLLHFAVGYYFVVLMAPDLSKLGKINQLLRPYPELIMLGALLERRRLVTVAEFGQLAKSSADIGQQRAMLVHTLGASLQQGLLNTLSHHTSQMSRLLTQHSQGAEQDADGGDQDKAKN